MLFALDVRNCALVLSRSLEAGRLSSGFGLPVMTFVNPWVAVAIVDASGMKMMVEIM